MFGACGAAALYRRAMIDDVADPGGAFFDEALLRLLRGSRRGLARAAPGLARRLPAPRSLALPRGTAERGPAAPALALARGVDTSGRGRFHVAKNRYLTLLRNDTARGYLRTCRSSWRATSQRACCSWRPARRAGAALASAGCSGAWRGGDWTRARARHHVEGVTPGQVAAGEVPRPAAERPATGAGMTATHGSARVVTSARLPDHVRRRLALSLALTPRMREAALRFGIVDRPDGRLKTPARAGPVPGRARDLPLVPARARADLPVRRARCSGCCSRDRSWCSLGLVDDLGQLGPWTKLAGQLVAVLVLVKSGIYIQLTFLPTGVALSLSVLWLLAVTNAFNLIDIMDGLSAGTATVAALTLLVVAGLNGDDTSAILLAGLAGACSGFLRYNFQPARIYMGDTGSLFLGLLLGALAMDNAYTARNAARRARPGADPRRAAVRHAVRHVRPAPARPAGDARQPGPRGAATAQVAPDARGRPWPARTRRRPCSARRRRYDAAAHTGCARDPRRRGGVGARCSRSCSSAST